MRALLDIERKSTGEIRVKTIIFTIFNGNGGIFAWKVKFTVFTVKNCFQARKFFSEQIDSTF